VERNGDDQNIVRSIVKTISAFANDISNLEEDMLFVVQKRLKMNLDFQKFNI